MDFFASVLSPGVFAASVSAIDVLLAAEPAATGTEAGESVTAPIPTPPSDLRDLPAWIEAVRELLRGQEDRPIAQTGIAYLVRKHFLEHLERLYPGEWPAWHQTFQPQKFQAVRDLVAMMAWVGQRVGGKSPAATKVAGFATKPPDPVANSKAVVLYGPADRPVVNEKSKAPLTKPQYEVILTLIRAGDNGLTKDELDRESKHGDARKIMRRLANNDDDWKSVLLNPQLASARVDSLSTRRAAARPV